MDQEENYFGENNNEDYEKDDEEIYDDIPEEPKDLKSPKKRWKERHSSGNSKEVSSHHRSPRRYSDERGRGQEEEDYSSKGHRTSGDSTDHRRRSDELSDDNGAESFRKSSKKHDDEDHYLKSKQRKLKEKLRKIEAEDGEILEDGEIEEADETGSRKQENNSEPRKVEREMSEKTDASFECNEESGGEIGEEENFEEEEGLKKKERRRKHRDHGRDKRRKSRDDHHKKRKRRPDYVDHDKVNDDEMQQAWLGGNKKQSQKGTRRQESNHHGKRDRKKQRYQSPAGPYDSPYDSPPGPYDSPPGPYDSPSYDEDSQEEYQEEGYEDYKEKRKQKKQKKNSMMSLMQGDEYIDANVAVDEGENLYKKREGGKKQKQKNYNKRKFDRQHSEQPPKKKPLLETPMDERPVCRFYKEGKCHKGSECPFNHELAQKKPELCKYYLGGSCSKGDDCIFMHSEYPCKFYHTGQECFQGDNCKFSHDEPSEDTAPIVERMNSLERHDHREDEEFQGSRQRPGVLGSPPRHLKEQMDRIKKIPSLFDIKTFPPGQSPQKPLLQGVPMNNSPQQRMQGPNQGQQQRPMGFYNDTMQGGMRGPLPGGPMGPQGLMNMPPRQMGPQGPVMAGPGQMGPMGGPQGPPMGGPQGPMNIANSMGHGPMQMGGPPNSMGPMAGPVQQGPMGGPMGGPMQQGPPMSMGQGPPMMNQGGMMGPQQGSMGGPPRMNNPNLNPALAIVGALLRHVNPQIVPQVSQAMSIPPMQDPRQVMGILSPKGQGIDNQDYRPDFSGTSLGSQEEAYSPRDDEEPRNKLEPSDINNENSKSDIKIKREEMDENEKKLAMMGLDLGSLSQLPPKQRELMMRLQQHGGQSEGEEEKANVPIKRERIESFSSDDKPKSKVDDDNWYSSDEDEGGAPKLTDVLKNLAKTEGSTQPVETTSSGSSINVMQMINAIKNQSGNLPNPSPVRDPRQRTTDQRAMPLGNEVPGGHMSFPHPADPRTFTSGLTVPPISKWNSEPAIINSRPGDAEWRCIRVTVDSSRRTEPPEGINLLDPQFKNDPRIKKFLDNLNMKKENKNPQESSQLLDSKPIDPRSKPSALSDGPKDPRLKKSGESSATEVKPLDPRLQRTISENASSRASDPRTRGASNPPSGVHNLPVRSVDPRASGTSVQRSNDPRLSRQLSHDSGGGGTGPNMILNVPKPSDPRLLPISLTDEIASPSPSDILASLQYPTDSLTGQKSDTNSVKQNSVRDPRSKSIENFVHEQGDDQLSRQASGGSDSESSSSQASDVSKTKIDYRNDPRFKVKIKPSSESTQRRYGGQRKGSMEYSSPLDAESEQRDNSGGYNSYNRPPVNNPKTSGKQDQRKSDPRVKNESESLSVPELPAFIPPQEENISTKRFFKQMDPTASPFC